ncbi:MAG: alpha/beta hydrolase-fold protein, partial [Candidatus Bipolaricaulis sp.]|nr:alpha/beta hydrolase-fold protein [Candidatus Bipolaricaulis sp.]
MSQVLRRTVGTPNPPVVLTMASEVLGEERRIYLQLPVGYDGCEQRYPVLVVLDGEWLFELARSHVQFYSEFAAMGVE